MGYSFCYYISGKRETGVCKNAKMQKCKQYALCRGLNLLKISRMHSASRPRPHTAPRGIFHSGRHFGAENPAISGVENAKIERRRKRGVLARFCCFSGRFVPFSGKSVPFRGGDGVWLHDVLNVLPRGCTNGRCPPRGWIIRRFVWRFIKMQKTWRSPPKTRSNICTSRKKVVTLQQKTKPIKI